MFSEKVVIPAKAGIQCFQYRELSGLDPPVKPEDDKPQCRKRYFRFNQNNVENLNIHRTKLKIYYEDTDAGGVVYYANYLRYMERARTEFLLEKGIDVTEFHNKGYLFAVVHVDVRYRKPARLGETIEVTTEIVDMQNVTITLRHHILRANTLLVDATVKIACINKDGKPQRLPSEFASLF